MIKKMAFKIKQFFLVLLILACLCIRFSYAQPEFPIYYANSIEIVKPEQYMFYWNYTSSYIIGEIWVKTLGWISFGITNAESTLDNSDLFVAWITNYGEKTVFIDSHFIGSSQIMPDDIQNWNLIDSKEEEGYTMIKFSRNITVTDVDPYYDIDIDIGTPGVSYAWGSIDPTDFINYESAQKGIIPIPLRSGKLSTYGDPFVSRELHYFISQNKTLPNAQDNYYHCSPHTAPTNTTTRSLHLISVYFSVTKKYLLNSKEVMKLFYILKNIVIYEDNRE
jgi:hypothetical protein